MEKSAFYQNASSSCADYRQSRGVRCLAICTHDNSLRTRNFLIIHGEDDSKLRWMWFLDVALEPVARGLNRRSRCRSINTSRKMEGQVKQSRAERFRRVPHTHLLSTTYRAQPVRLTATRREPEWTCRRFTLGCTPRPA